MENNKTETIDMTPTWGEVGLLCLRLALSNEQDALRHAAPEVARAFGMAHALSAIWSDLSDEQRAKAGEVVKTESAKAARAYS